MKPLGRQPSPGGMQPWRGTTTRQDGEEQQGHGGRSRAAVQGRQARAVVDEKADAEGRDPVTER